MNRRDFTARATLGAVAGAAGAPQVAAAAADGPVPANGSSPPEDVLDPGLPIVDAHHHLWSRRSANADPRDEYLLTQFLAEIDASGHAVTDTICVETKQMYRAGAAPELASLGETEFMNGIAAMSASGGFGPRRIASGIVAFIDLRLGEAMRPLLDAHLGAAKSRLKGIRNSGAWDAYPVMGVALDPARARWLDEPGVPRSLRILAAHDLVFESWLLHPQIPRFAALAGAVPEATLVLDHVGTPLSTGPYAADPRRSFDDWHRNIRELARRPNVFVKLGGLGMAFVSPALAARTPQAGSEEIARAWKPVIEACIEAFGPERCMFESNFPPDAASCSYRILWNAFKRIAAGYSASERTALFSGTAKRLYRLA